MKCWKTTTKSNNSLGLTQNKAANEEKKGKITGKNNNKFYNSILKLTLLIIALKS